MSFLFNLENFSGLIKRKMRKAMQATKRRIIVRLTGESSLSPIFIDGNANAQKMIVHPIMKKKYFFVVSFFVKSCSGIV
jgi:hypothetical protein